MALNSVAVSSSGRAFIHGSADAFVATFPFLEREQINYYMPAQRACRGCWQQIVKNPH